MPGLLDLINAPQGTGGGLLDGLQSWAGNNSNALVGLGAGIAGGGKNWNEAVGRGLQGIHPQIAQMAMSNPEILKAIIPNIVPKYDFRSINNVGGRFDPATGRWDPV